MISLLCVIAFRQNKHEKKKKFVKGGKKAARPKSEINLKNS